MSVLAEYEVAKLFDLLSRRVQIQLVDQSSVEGYVYTVDPETLNVVILQRCEGQSALAQVIFGDAISSIQVIDGEAPLTALGLNLSDDDFGRMLRGTQRQPACAAEPAGDGAAAVEMERTKDAQERRVMVEKLLAKHRLPYSTDANTTAISVMGLLHIDPPYTADSCRSSNEIVLQQIKTLLSQNAPLAPAE